MLDSILLGTKDPDGKSHRGLHAPRLFRIDVRPLLKVKTNIQLIAFYGYPHPNASGQAIIARDAVAAVIAGVLKGT